MSTATLTIQPGGSASITLDGSTSPISAAGVQAAQAVGMRQIKRHATRTGAPVDVQIIDPQGTTHFHVAVDGTITHATPPQPDTGEAWAQPQQQPAPAAQPAGTAADWAPPTAEATDVAPTAVSVSAPAPTAPTPSGQPTIREIPAEEPPQPPAEATPEPAAVDPEWEQRAQQPATQGWKGTLNGLGLTLAPSETELTERRAAYDNELAEAERQRLEQEAAAQREAENARQHQEQQTRREARRREEEKTEREHRRVIQTNFQGARTILVANPKGGARKTTTTYLVGATLGIIRGGGVITWDANETMGTLGDRAAQDVHSRTVVDLLEQAADDFSSIEGSRLGTLDRFVRNQRDSHFDVLASDEDATRQDIVDGAGFQRVHEILTRFYRLVLVDTGNNIRTQHFLAAAEAADQLVIPVAASRDSARPALAMMKALTASGHGDLVSNAVVLIHDLEALNDADDTYLETVSEIATEFEGKVSAVVPIPFDAALKGGDEIDYALLSDPTRRAYREATAAITGSLRRATLEH